MIVDFPDWMDWINGSETRETALLDEFLGREPRVDDDLILAEVLQGFRDDRDLRRAREALDALFFEPMFGRDIAFASARNFRALRARGVTARKSVDRLTATLWVENGHELLHVDRDFHAIEAECGMRTL